MYGSFFNLNQGVHGRAGTLAVFGALFYKTLERKPRSAHAGLRIPERKVKTGGVAAKPNVPNTAVEKNIELGGIAAKAG